MCRISGIVPFSRPFIQIYCPDVAGLSASREIYFILRSQQPLRLSGLWCRNFQLKNLCKRAGFAKNYVKIFLFSRPLLAMVKTCAAFNCENGRRRENRNRTGGATQATFHKFPLENPEILKLWLKNISRDSSFKPTEHTRLCSLHFVETDFEADSMDTNWKTELIPLSSRVFLLIWSKRSPRKNERRG